MSGRPEDLVVRTMGQLLPAVYEDAIRPAAPTAVEDARRVVAVFVAHYNGVRLHSAIGYVTPNDRLAGRAPFIWAERDRKLELAREHRRLRRAALRQRAAA